MVVELTGENQEENSSSYQLRLLATRVGESTGGTASGTDHACMHAPVGSYTQVLAQLVLFRACRALVELEQLSWCQHHRPLQQEVVSW